MIPLRDSTPSPGMPLATAGLVIANCFVFWLEISSSPALSKFIVEYALIPAAYVRPGPWDAAALLEKQIPLVSALFLHGGWLHLIANMWFLWIFGASVEHAMGKVRFLLFYVVCGVIGNLAHVLMNTASEVPVLGASGCIAGVLGAYFLFFPARRIVTVLPIFIFWTVAEVPAFFFLGIWFLIQFLSGVGPAPGGAAVAWWAHIAGFLSGILLGPRFSSARRR